MRIGFGNFTIIPPLPFVLREFAQHGDQSIESRRASVRGNLPTGRDGNLQNFSRVGYNVKCEREDYRRRYDASEARHVRYDLTRRSSATALGTRLRNSR